MKSGYRIFQILHQSLQQIHRPRVQKAIHDAESEPIYIKDQGSVKQALQEAKVVNAASNPTPSVVRTAAKKLNDAVAAAKQSEAAIQSAALAAIIKAENDKTAGS